MIFLFLFVFYLFFSFIKKKELRFLFEKIVKVVTLYLVELLNNMFLKNSTKNISLLSIKHIDIGFLGFDSIIGMITILEK